MLVKKFYCSILFVLIVGTLFAQEPAVFEEPINGPKIVFSEDRHEFGDIIQGDVIEHVFEFLARRINTNSIQISIFFIKV